MENTDRVETKSPSTEGKDVSSNIEVQVESFTTAKPKFTKEAWDSGEGGGEGEG
jgi:hypothetical protein